MIPRVSGLGHETRDTTACVYPGDFAHQRELQSILSCSQRSLLAAPTIRFVTMVHTCKTALASTDLPLRLLILLAEKNDITRSRDSRRDVTTCITTHQRRINTHRVRKGINEKTYRPDEQQCYDPPVAQMRNGAHTLHPRVGQSLSGLSLGLWIDARESSAQGQQHQTEK